MVKCIFCGKEESPHKGMNFIKNDGSVNYFCSAKCRKNAVKLKRDKRKVRWTESFHVSRDKTRARAEENKKKSEESKEKVKESLKSKK